jgi:ribonuclease HI
MILLRFYFLTRLAGELDAEEDVHAIDSTGTEGYARRVHTNSCAGPAAWTPPVGGIIKANVDGAFNPTTGTTVVGVVPRDNEGNPKLMAWCMLSRCRDPEETEALACLEGILLAEHWPPDVQVVLESDCSTVVEKIKSQAADRSVIDAIIHDIKEAMGRRQQCSVKRLRCHQNQIAHNLAQYGIKSRSSKVSFSSVPFCIQDLICNEQHPRRNLVDRM